jgi:carbonic anhydrase
MTDKLLEGNRKFLETEFTKQKEFFQKLAQGQSPSTLWIGCSDSRVGPERITGSRAGEIFVHRNIGNVVAVNSMSFATVAEYAINHLKVKEIVVCGHSDCGAMKALAAGKEGGDAFIPLWLNNAAEAKQRVEKQGAPAGEKERRTALEKENVRLQLEHLRAYPLVKKALSEGRVKVRGLYYDLETGTLSEVS